jgi:hypothetical protein
MGFVYYDQIWRQEPGSKASGQGLDGRDLHRRMLRLVARSDDAVSNTHLVEGAGHLFQQLDAMDKYLDPLPAGGHGGANVAEHDRLARAGR